MNLEEYDFDRLLGLGYTEKATGDLKNACWKGFTAVGTKKKGGREVPNCVPIKKSDHSEMTGEELTQGRITPTDKRRPFIFGPGVGSPSFAESDEDTLDFARCRRPDGTHYGTAGTCRKGTQVKDLEERIKRQERFLRTADPSKYSRKEIEIEKKELQRMKSQLAGMKSTMRKKS